VRWIDRVGTCEDTSILQTCIFVTHITVSGVCCHNCHGFEMTVFDLAVKVNGELKLQILRAMPLFFKVNGTR